MFLQWNSCNWDSQVLNDVECIGMSNLAVSMSAEDTNSDERVSYTEFIRWLFHGGAEAVDGSGSGAPWSTVGAK